MRCLNCGLDGLAAATVRCPGCQAHLPALLRDALPRGTFLRGGAYRLEYPLGRGGFGITYRAVHVALEQPVAIKEFYPRDQAVRDPATGRLHVAEPYQALYQWGLRRFVQEARILAQHGHPNVVRVSDLFEERATAYLVMELVHGRTLRKELDAQPGRRLEVERVHAVVEQLVGALDSVHEAGVFHLDLKPDNVLLTDSDRVVLTDFGSARQGASHRGTQAYTTEYAAPEVLAGGDVGPETDLFELGMMVHEMLTGQRPPPAVKRLVSDTWEPKGLREPWQRLLAAALRLDKQDRPKSLRGWWQEVQDKTTTSNPLVKPARARRGEAELLAQIESQLGPVPVTVASACGELPTVVDQPAAAPAADSEILEQLRRLLEG